MPGGANVARASPQSSCSPISHTCAASADGVMPAKLHALNRVLNAWRTCLENFPIVGEGGSSGGLQQRKGLKACHTTVFELLKNTKEKNIVPPPYTDKFVLLNFLIMLLATGEENY